MNLDQLREEVKAKLQDLYEGGYADLPHLIETETDSIMQKIAEHRKRACL